MYKLRFGSFSIFATEPFMNTGISPNCALILFKFSKLFLNRTFPLLIVSFKCFGLYKRLISSSFVNALRLLFRTLADKLILPLRKSISLNCLAKSGGKMNCRA